ncbi:hypothetical protein [Olivibacter ginsenosidimutans]|uniref:hypothetical protein n=1 Tax=Olivibacter ginsenosidimutans TaxID=1176537 RepID=UPI0031EEB41C
MSRLFNTTNILKHIAYGNSLVKTVKHILMRHILTQQRKDYLRQLIAWFQLCLFLAILANNVLFQHVHRFADGTIIVHAHPFPKNTSHQHTKSEYVLLDAVFHAMFLLVTAPYQAKVIESTWCIIGYRQAFNIPLIAIFCSFLRGPPVIN